MWCVVGSNDQLSSPNISGCFLLQVMHLILLLLVLPIIHSWSYISVFLVCICSQLKDDCLSATTESCPLIESLILMSCPSVGSDGLYSLRWLPYLTLLDLSYTFLINLQPVFESCLQLKVSYCGYFWLFTPPKVSKLDKDMGMRVWRFGNSKKEGNLWRFLSVNLEMSLFRNNWFLPN